MKTKWLLPVAFLAALAGGCLMTSCTDENDSDSDDDEVLEGGEDEITKVPVVRAEVSESYNGVYVGYEDYIYTWDHALTSIETVSYNSDYTVKERTTTYVRFGDDATATAEDEEIWYDSSSYEISKNTHTAKFNTDGYVVSGTLSFEENGSVDTYQSEITYNADGYPVRTRNRCSDESGDWETYTLTWTDGDLTKLTNGEATVIIEYADKSLLNLHTTFDLNWFLVSDEWLDFGAGDQTKIWAVLGKLGRPSKHLMTSLKSSYKNETCTYTLTYSQNDEYETRVVVSEGESRKSWVIEYN